MRIAPTVAALTGTAAAAVLLAGCASSGGSTSPQQASGASTTAPTGSVSSSAVAASSSVSPGPGAARITASESQNGTTIGVVRGAEVIVTLHNTYWRFAPVSGPKVLSQSAPTVHAVAPGVASVPGSGHGTIVETFHARAAGTAVISTSRTTCGEAMRCPPAQSSYRITVTVR